MGNFFKLLALIAVVSSCEKQTPVLRIACATAEPTEVSDEVYVRVIPYKFEQAVEKNTPDFTLSFYADKSLSFKEAVSNTKSIMDELRRLGWKTYAPDAVIFKLDTLITYKTSAEALSFMSKVRNKLNHKGTFTVYMTKQNIGGHCLCAGKKQELQC